jgi:copper transport protein
VILGVVALWRFTPPPRAMMVRPYAQIELHLHDERAMAVLEISPGSLAQLPSPSL